MKSYSAYYSIAIRFEIWRRRCVYISTCSFVTNFLDLTVQVQKSIEDES